MNDRFTMWLTEDERAALDQAHERTGLSRNQITRAALRNLLGLEVPWPLLAALGPEETPA